MDRPPEFAGSFYPSDPEDLSQLLSELLGPAGPGDPNALGIISPHAGYIYSGKVAAAAYGAVGRRPSGVLILGPSHHHAFRGIALWPYGRWLTPLGSLEVDEEGVLALDSASDLIFPEPGFHGGEHSVEVQLPFVQAVWGQVPIIPGVVGQLELGDVKSLGATVAHFLRERPDYLLVVSSDLYHGYDYQECLERDNLTLSYVERLEASAFWMALVREEVMACGGMGIAVAMEAVSILGGSARRVAYTNSAEVMGEYHGGYVVGYGAVLFTWSPGGSPGP